MSTDAQRRCERYEVRDDEGAPAEVTPKQLEKLNITCVPVE